jgi:hypothetical protein
MIATLAANKNSLKKHWTKTLPIHGTLASNANRIYLPRIMIQQHYTKGQSQPKSYEED